ncbi:recombinase RecT [Mesorhizobium sp. B2-5-11]|uniref:recombinase RecT n=1 Tax=Mesorhizobium sp. B2-5-11 TaxID=2589919 RepID=UPI0011278D92|nr:recombinase RecT [Mesorhizobium sp. B2-5-11]TPK14127.1 recombinase [Mesorhizobium sp. B2-5-11]
MNAVTKTENAKPSLIAVMAAQRNMDPEQFAKTVRATVMPANHTNEQFAALMLVASKYDLDPILKEIYAFPAKGGGIVPIVSIDGWLNLMNSHPAFDGLETEFTDDEQGNPISCTCRIYRKDRSKPIIVTEYLSECIRQTDPWKMKRRMLRHKAVIQCNRYAFGFSGIYDEDEGEKIAEMRDVTPMTRPVPPKPPVSPSAQIAGPSETIDNETGEITVDAVADGIDGDTPDVTDDAMVDDTTYFEQLEAALAVVSDAASVEEVWTEFDPLSRFEGQPNAETNQSIALAIRKQAEKRIAGAK